MRQPEAHRVTSVTIRVVPYNTQWPAQYAAEATRMREALGEVAVALHHIGSTAVPGLSAKPIIDILAEVSDLAELDARAHAIESLGYESKGEFGIPGRRYFRRDDASGSRTHQVHAFEVRSLQAERHLAFRDYLISHPQVAHAYAELKHGLARRFPNDIHGYMRGKDSFVKHYEAEALAWRSSRITSSCSGP
jgi:GrpB-like predicted nucleotidyltransferase (UPF0157 family)